MKATQTQQVKADQITRPPADLIAGPAIHHLTASAATDHVASPAIDHIARTAIDHVTSPAPDQIVWPPSRPPRSRARVSVVIPTLNEAANLPHVFARLPLGELFEIILVDGHSTDDTIEIARALHPPVRIVLQDGKGKGNALACGFAAAQGDIIVMLDADGSTDPQEIPAYVDALYDGADFAKGSRFTDGGGSVDITPLRRQGNRLLNGTVNALFGTRYSDLCYGYNAFWSDLRPTLNVDCAGFEVETLINVRVAKAGLKVAEVPSFEQERIHGVSKLHPVRDGLRVLRTILRERFAWS